MTHPELILIMSAIEALREFVPKPVGLVATTIRDADAKINQTVSIFFLFFGQQFRMRSKVSIKKPKPKVSPRIQWTQ